MIAKFFGLLGIVGGILGLLIAYEKLPMKMVDPGDMELWHQRYGKLVKILGPIFIVVGLLVLIGLI